MAKKKLFEIDKDSIVKATKHGYYYCTTTPDHPRGEKRKDRKKRYVYLHRARLEQKLGRYLKSNEQVDHIDGNKANNDISNLELKVHGEHQRDHANNGNSFWKTSPLNKPGVKRKAQRVASNFLEIEVC